MIALKPFYISVRVFDTTLSVRQVRLRLIAYPPLIAQFQSELIATSKPQIESYSCEPDGNPQQRSATFVRL
jgi:hypothetical protein